MCLGFIKRLVGFPFDFLIQFIIIHFAILLNGSVSVPVDPNTTVNSFREIVKQSIPKLVIVYKILKNRLHYIE